MLWEYSFYSLSKLRRPISVVCIKTFLVARNYEFLEMKLATASEINLLVPKSSLSIAS